MQERDLAAGLAEQVQEVTGGSVKVAFVDQGYTGAATEADVAEEGVELIVVKHHEAKKGFVLLPRRWVVEQTFGWLGRFRRLARDYERLPETLAAWHWVAFIALMLNHRSRLRSCSRECPSPYPAVAFSQVVADFAHQFHHA
jgi:transposase